jgi:hypothetical protein
MTPQEELNKAKTALRDGEVYTYKGVKYSLTKLRDELIPLLEEDVVKEEKRVEAETKTKNLESSTQADVKNQTKLSIKRAKTLKKDADFSANAARTKFANGDISEQEYTAALDLPDKIQADIDAMESGSVNAKISGTNSYQIIGEEPAPTAMRGAEALAGEKRTATGTPDPATTVKSKVTVVKNGNNVEITTYMDGRISEKVLGPSNLPDTAASNLPKGTSGKPAAMKTYVDEQLKAKGLADTPANRKTLRSEYQASQPAPAADNSWEQLFIQNNPAKAWYLTELDRAKYPQLFAVLKQYTLPRPLTVEEQSAFAAKLDGTDFFQELSTSGKVREIKNVVGELGFDSTDFTKFVHTAINMGYTGDRLKQETYKEVFKTGADGKYVNPTALARASKSADYLNVVNTARSYFNTAGANQASVQSVLTGGITTEDFQRQQREIAKKRYPHLADLIDQGVSLESLAGNFQTTAAKLLEVDPNTIDMSAADYEVALNFGEEGKKRVMTTGEWDKLLRTDSRYGWEKTNNAKQEARGLAANLVQAFGRII